MEKISRILGNSPRVGATDLKNAPAVRPGTPSFGRPIGNSSQGENDSLSTAQRATLLKDDMIEQKRARAESKIAQDSSARFFLGQEEMGRPAAVVAPAKGTVKMEEQELEMEPLAHPLSARTEALVEEGDQGEARRFNRFTPRGSIVDVHA
jgi:hypothetical protein